MYGLAYLGVLGNNLYFLLNITLQNSKNCKYCYGSGFPNDEGLGFRVYCAVRGSGFSVLSRALTMAHIKDICQR